MYAKTLHVGRSNPPGFPRILRMSALFRLSDPEQTIYNWAQGITENDLTKPGLKELSIQLCLCLY